MYISRKRLLLMSITILIMILLSNIFGFSNSNFESKSGITTARVNLRKNTSLDSSSIIKTIDNGTNVNVVGDIDNFYITMLPTNEVGLVSKDYITLQQNEPAINKGYQNIEKINGTIKSDKTNIRSGPGTNFTVSTTLNTSSNVEVIGKLNDWYLVITPNNYVGFIRNDLIDIPNDESNNNTDSETLPNTTETILTLINIARKNEGMPELQIDDLLDSTAKTKAKDMVENDYFAHESPTYGSPFKMMQEAGITYKTAGENIAGNQSVQKAVESWLASETHRQNILSNAYNYIGIGLEKSDTYGYVIVLMFIGK